MRGFRPSRLGEFRPSRLDLCRAAAVLAALYLTAGLAWLVPSPGYSAARLALFLVVLAAGWLGAAGAVLGRPLATAAGGGGLFLLGFWQAVLWTVVLPAGLVLLAIALAHPAGDDVPTGHDDAATGHGDRSAADADVRRGGRGQNQENH